MQTTIPKIRIKGRLILVALLAVPISCLTAQVSTIGDPEQKSAQKTTRAKLAEIFSGDLSFDPEAKLVVTDTPTSNPLPGEIFVSKLLKASRAAVFKENDSVFIRFTDKSKSVQDPSFYLLLGQLPDPKPAQLALKLAIRVNSFETVAPMGDISVSLLFPKVPDSEIRHGFSSLRNDLIKVGEWITIGGDRAKIFNVPPSATTVKLWVISNDAVCDIDVSNISVTAVSK